MEQVLVRAGAARQDTNTTGIANYHGINLERNAGITGDVTAVEIGRNFAALNGWKFDGNLVAFYYAGFSCGLDSTPLFSRVIRRFTLPPL